MTSVLDRLATETDLPVVKAGVNVFSEAEYRRYFGISESEAYRRLRELKDKGDIRRVRIQHNGKFVRAWQYIATERKKAEK